MASIVFSAYRSNKKKKKKRNKKKKNQITPYLIFIIDYFFMKTYINIFIDLTISSDSPLSLPTSVE